MTVRELVERLQAFFDPNTRVVVDDDDYERGEGHTDVVAIFMCKDRDCNLHADPHLVLDYKEPSEWTK